MTALTAHPHPARSVLPPHAGTGDRRPILWALTAAVVLHIAALGIPLPKVPPPETPARSEQPTARVHIPFAAPPLSPPPVSTSAPTARRLPVPFRTPEHLTEPLDEAAPPIDPDRPPMSIGFLGTENPEPPPEAPSAYPEGTRGLIAPIRQLDAARVVYPRMARQARQQGRVVLRAVITETGEVDRIEVLTAPEPDLGFVEAAIEAVSGWRYEPGMLNRRPVAVALTVVVEFSLN